MKELDVSDKIRCVAVILVNEEGEVLLQQRSDKLDAFPSHWAPFGGRVEGHEPPEAAMRRELKAEVEIETALSFWKVHDHIVELTDELAVPVEEHLFIGCVDLDPAALSPKEAKAVKFFPRADLAELPIAFRFRDTLEEFFSHWGA